MAKHPVKSEVERPRTVNPMGAGAYLDQGHLQTRTDPANWATVDLTQQTPWEQIQQSNC